MPLTLTGFGGLAPAAGGGGGGPTLIATTIINWQSGGGAETKALNVSGANPTDLIVIYTNNGNVGTQHFLDIAGTNHTLNSVYTAGFTDPAGYTNTGYVGSLTSNDISAATLSVSSHMAAGGFQTIAQIWRGATTFTFLCDGISSQTDTTLAIGTSSPAGGHLGALLLVSDSGGPSGTLTGASPGTWSVINALNANGNAWFAAGALKNVTDYTGAATTVSSFSAEQHQRGLLGVFT